MNNILSIVLNELKKEKYNVYNTSDIDLNIIFNAHKYIFIRIFHDFLAIGETYNSESILKYRIDLADPALFDKIISYIFELKTDIQTEQCIINERHQYLFGGSEKPAMRRQSE